MEENDDGDKEEQLNETDAQLQQQQQQLNNETSVEAMQQDDNNDDADDDEIPIEGSFIPTLYGVYLLLIAIIFCACSSVKGQASSL